MSLTRIAAAVGIVVASLGISIGVAAQSAPTTVAGEWTVSYDRASTPLSVKIDGATVTGTYGGRAIQGELAKGTLTFALPDDWAAWQQDAMGSPDAKDMYQTVHAATLEADGRLHGTSDTYVRGTNMIKRTTWTAARVKGR